MPRKARIHASGVLHHIMIRGIELRAIFEDPQEYQSFIERLGNILTDSSTPCYAWALLTNHVHLLLRSGMVSVATIMRWIPSDCDSFVTQIDFFASFPYIAYTTKTESSQIVNCFR